MLSLELGALRLAYSFALAASMLVVSPAQWRWRQGELVQLTKKGVVRSNRPFRPLP